MLLLQGLLPRLAELAKLGGRFFLAFLPAVLIISGLFTGIYAVSCCCSFRHSACPAEHACVLHWFFLLSHK